MAHHFIVSPCSFSLYEISLSYRVAWDSMRGREKLVIFDFLLSVADRCCVGYTARSAHTIIVRRRRRRRGKKGYLCGCTGRESIDNDYWLALSLYYSFAAYFSRKAPNKAIFSCSSSLRLHCLLLHLKKWLPLRRSPTSSMCNRTTTVFWPFARYPFFSYHIPTPITGNVCFSPKRVDAIQLYYSLLLPIVEARVVKWSYAIPTFRSD